MFSNDVLILKIDIRYRIIYVICLVLINFLSRSATMSWLFFISSASGHKKSNCEPLKSR